MSIFWGVAFFADPSQWSPDQVQEWLRSVQRREHGLPSLDPGRFAAVTGRQLSAMTREELHRLTDSAYAADVIMARLADVISKSHQQEVKAQGGSMHNVSHIHIYTVLKDASAPIKLEEIPGMHLYIICMLCYILRYAKLEGIIYIFRMDFKKKFGLLTRVNIFKRWSLRGGSTRKWVPLQSLWFLRNQVWPLELGDIMQRVDRHLPGALGQWLALLLDICRKWRQSSTVGGALEARDCDVTVIYQLQEGAWPHVGTDCRDQGKEISFEVKVKSVTDEVKL